MCCSKSGLYLAWVALLSMVGEGGLPGAGRLGGGEASVPDIACREKWLEPDQTIRLRYHCELISILSLLEQVKLQKETL